MAKIFDPEKTKGDVGDKIDKTDYSKMTVQ